VKGLEKQKLPVQLYNENLDASMASNTKDTYKVGLDSFQAFRVEYNSDLIWPPPPSHIVLFVAYLSLKGKAHSTARML
jgi:hypothetical protein